jgi:hypothetical protein
MIGLRQAKTRRRCQPAGLRGVGAVKCKDANAVLRASFDGLPQPHRTVRGAPRRGRVVLIHRNVSLSWRTPPQTAIGFARAVHESAGR